MDKRRAEIERSLRREQYPKVDIDPRLVALGRWRGRRWGRPGDSGLEPAPVEPRDGGGLSGGAAAAIPTDEDR